MFIEMDGDIMSYVKDLFIYKWRYCRSKRVNKIDEGKGVPQSPNPRPMPLCKPPRSKDMKSPVPKIWKSPEYTIDVSKILAIRHDSEYNIRVFMGGHCIHLFPLGGDCTKEYKEEYKKRLIRLEKQWMSYLECELL